MTDPNGSEFENGQHEPAPRDRRGPARPRKVYTGMWGIPEIAVFGVAVLAVLLTAILYLLLVFPAQRDLERNRASRNELEKQIFTARNRYGSITSTKERVSEIIRSAEDFETRFLRPENESKVALYQRINTLMSGYGLVNTSGPDYVPLEITDANRTQTAEENTGRSKFISIFPGVYVTMTVDGSYQNLRRFIRDIENGSEFVVVSAVELEPSENQERQPSGEASPTTAGANVEAVPPGFPSSVPQPAPVRTDRGKTRGETVTLRLELAAYYRRANFSPTPVEAEAVR